MGWQVIRHPRDPLVDAGAQGEAVGAPGCLDVLERDCRAGVLLAHGPAQDLAELFSISRPTVYRSLARQVGGAFRGSVSEA